MSRGFVEVARKSRVVLPTGGYVLQFERPHSRAALDVTLADVKSDIMSNQVTRYQRLFADLGLDQKEITSTIQHLDKICEASLGAEAAITQLLAARKDYDTRLRELLREDSYRSYRKAESAEPARHEVATFKESLLGTEPGLDLDSSMESRLVEEIQAAGAYTVERWHGPYDGLPRIVLGAGALRTDIQRRIDAGVSRWERVLAAFEASGASPMVLTALRSYVARWKQGLENVHASIPERPEPGFRFVSPHATVVDQEPAAHAVAGSRSTDSVKPIAGPE
jgi:hypothetical protein